MSFDRGPITYRVCTLPDTLPEDMLERFAANAAPALSAIGEEPAWGWVSGRHLLETRIDEEMSGSAISSICASVRRSARSRPRC